jgi:hypothetical protein
VKAVGGSPPFLMEVNILKPRAKILVVGKQQEIAFESHLRHLREIVQTMELRVVEMSKVSNLTFVFTKASLQDDPSNSFNTCQGMATAFL